MARRISTTLALALLFGAAGPSQASGQIRAILDWINSLSGPGLVRVGAGVGLVQIDDANLVTVTPLMSVHVDDRGNPDTEAADLFNVSARAALESTLFGDPGSTQLRSSFGVALHRWSGEFETFWSPSFPIMVSLHVPMQDWAFQLGTGFNVFSFPEDAFAPFDTGVETEGFDAGWTLQLGAQYSPVKLFN